MQRLKQEYNSEVAWLIESAELCPLGRGTPNRIARSKLDAMTAEGVAAPHMLADQSMARACLSGLWLLHNFLDESHEISQTLNGPTGAFWHGIMHRRELGYSNAKYWFCRVGVHPIFELLALSARSAAQNSEVAASDERATFIRKQRLWDPNRFIDLCQSIVEEDSELNLLCRHVQQVEWQMLFDHCYQSAIHHAPVVENDG